MPPYVYDEQGRRVVAPSKGERREQAILDEAEKQLRQFGPERMTVASIATAVGVTRAALYFYFRSKNDVLAALVRRVVDELSSGVATSDAIPGTDAAAAIASSLNRTEDLWRRHGDVMRAAVELTPSVPVVAELWTGARKAIVDSVLRIVAPTETANLNAADVPQVVQALVGMTEQSFYQASASGTPLNGVRQVLELVWRRALQLS